MPAQEQGSIHMADTSEETTGAAELLSIYLHDHRAGAAAGLALAKRSRRQASGALADTLAWLETQIDEDRRSLDSIMAGLGIDQSPLKNALSVAAERAGRLKLNGRLWKRSPLSTLIELEALAGAIYTKRNLWRSLAAVAERSSLDDPGQLAELIARADAQLERVESHHDEVARRVFEASSPADAAPRPSEAANAGAPPAPATTASPVVAADPIPSPVAPGDGIDQVLEDAEGGIAGSLLDAPEDAGPAI
jgi:hypothetical protein